VYFFLKRKREKKMTLFDLDVLNNEKARYVVVAEAFLPLVIGLCCCCVLYREKHISHDQRAFMSVFYLLICVLWGFSLFISSMNFDEVALILFASLSAVLLLVAIYCLFLMTHRHRYLIPVSLLFLFLVVIGVILGVTSPSSDLYAPMTVAVTFAPLAFASIAAFMPSYHEKHEKVHHHE
jgi:hypothetical protein